VGEAGGLGIAQLPGDRLDRSASGQQVLGAVAAVAIIVGLFWLASRLERRTEGSGE
jgi:hypothetical protein